MENLGPPPLGLRLFSLPACKPRLAQSPLRWHDGRVIVSADFSAVPDSRHAAEIEQL